MFFDPLTFHPTVRRPKSEQAGSHQRVERKTASEYGPKNNSRHDQPALKSDEKKKPAELNRYV